MLRIIFLKKKRFFSLNKKLKDLFYIFRTGAIVFFEYLSIDRDIFFKYKIYGLCVGMKRNLIMSVIYFNTVFYSNQINFVFFLYSPFIFNVKYLTYLNYSKSKIYNIVPKLRIMKQFYNF
jgi:hypothetical protein